MIRLNAKVSLHRHDAGINRENAVSLMRMYDIIVDCTDSPSTRYLISDAAIVCSKPLVSGSALGTEGQLAIYGYQGGPCYRCVFPKPPPPESVLSCGEGGILGPGAFVLVVDLIIVVGVIGIMQALEAIKIIVRSKPPSEDVNQVPYSPSMTMFSAFDTPQWRTFRLRQRKADCIACGTNPAITTDTIENTDYSALCLRNVPNEIQERVSAKVTNLDSRNQFAGIRSFERY